MAKSDLSCCFFISIRTFALIVQLGDFKGFQKYSQFGNYVLEENSKFDSFLFLNN